MWFDCENDQALKVVNRFQGRCDQNRTISIDGRGRKKKLAKWRKKKRNEGTEIDRKTMKGRGGVRQ